MADGRQEAATVDGDDDDDDDDDDGDGDGDDDNNSVDHLVRLRDACIV